MQKSEVKEKLQEIKEAMSEDYEKLYVDEVMDALEADCRRSSVVLGWGIFLHFLYHKIAEYGLDECARIAKKKKWLSGTLNYPYDLNKISDEDTLVLAREIGVLSVQLESQMRIQLNKRNNCAHIGDHKPGENTVLEFFEDIFQGIEAVQRVGFESRETAFVESILKMPEENISSLQKEGKKVVNAVKRIGDKLRYVKDEEVADKYANYFLYLNYLVDSSTDSEVIDEVINIFTNILTYEDYPRDRWNTFGEKLTRTPVYLERANDNSDLIEILIKSFAESWSFREAESRMRWILNVKELLNEEQVNRVAEAAAQNRQIYEAHKCRTWLYPFLFEKNREIISPGAWEDLQQVGLIK